MPGATQAVRTSQKGVAEPAPEQSTVPRRHLVVVGLLPTLHSQVSRGAVPAFGPHMLYTPCRFSQPLKPVVMGESQECWAANRAAGPEAWPP